MTLGTCPLYIPPFVCGWVRLLCAGVLACHAGCPPPLPSHLLAVKVKGRHSTHAREGGRRIRIIVTYTKPFGVKDFHGALPSILRFSSLLASLSVSVLEGRLKVVMKRSNCSSTRSAANC